MTEMLCFRCLTNDHQQVPAVTAFVGTMLCDRCARQEEHLRRQMIQEAASNLRL
jgi:NMD protein affecting ribosome stability and mRNA decay